MLNMMGERNDRSAATQLQLQILARELSGRRGDGRQRQRRKRPRLGRRAQPARRRAVPARRDRRRSTRPSYLAAKAIRHDRQTSRASRLARAARLGDERVPGDRRPARQPTVQGHRRDRHGPALPARIDRLGPEPQAARGAVAEGGRPPVRPPPPGVIDARRHGCRLGRSCRPCPASTSSSCRTRFQPSPDSKHWPSEPRRAGPHPADPRRRYRHRRLARPPLRRRVARRRTGRGHLRRPATSTRGRSPQNTLAVLELAGRGDVEVALGREVPLVRPLETTPETHGPRGLGYAELPPAARRALGAPRRGPADRRGAAPAGRADPRDARPADEPRGRGPARARAAAPLPRLRAHGRRLSVARQHGADDRVEHQRRSGRREGRVQCLDGRPRGDPSIARPVALGLDVTERAKITPDHVVALARRAGSTPDDSLRWRAARIRCRRPARSPRTRSSASSPTRCGSTWSSTRGTTASTGRSSTTRWRSRPPSTRRSIRTEALTVDVELGGTLTTGETVTDWRRVWGRPPNIDVAVEADAEAFLDRFVERVGRLAAERSGSAHLARARVRSSRRS